MVEGTPWSGITFKGHRDVYSFTTLLDVDTGKQKVSFFYKARSARLVSERKGLAFVRGRKLWSYFNLGPETLPLQRITVALAPRESDSGSVVNVVYNVKGWLIRLPP